MNLLGLMAILGFILIFLVLVVIKIIFISLLQSTLNEISPQNRLVSKNNLWFLLIPFLGNIYNFIVIPKLADSLKLEFSERNISVDDPRPGYNLGITYSILFFLCLVFIFIGRFNPFFNTFLKPCVIAEFIFFICYCAKISIYKKKLLEN